MKTTDPATHAANVSALAAESGESVARRLGVRNLCDALRDPELSRPTRYLLPGLIPEGSAILLYGSPKVGKTTLAAHLAAAIAAGKSFLGRPAKQRPVLYCDFERAVRLTCHRLGEPFGAEEPPRCLSLLSRQLNPEELRALIAWAGFGLVILDTLARLVQVENENDSAQMLRALAPWVDIAHDTGASLLLLHHDRKGGGENGQAARGSSSIVGAVDVAAHLKRDGASESARILVTVGNPDGLEPIIHLERDGTCYRTRPTSAQARRDRVLSMLRERGPLDLSSLCEALGEGRTPLQESLSALEGSEEVERLGVGRRGDPLRWVVRNPISAAPLGGAEAAESGPEEAV